MDTLMTDGKSETLIADLMPATTDVGSGFRQQLRERAAVALLGMRLPTVKDEPWRFLPLTSLLAHRYAVADATMPVLLPEISRFVVPEAEDHRLVFVDGHYAPELSCLLSPCPGLVLAPLSQLDDALLAQHLGSQVPPESDYFSALSTRSLEDGAAVIVPDGLDCPKPIQLLFVSTGKQPTHVAHRVLLVVGKQARATVVQESVCLDEGVYFNNVVTEVVINEGGALAHVRVQSESRQASHIESLAATLQRDARYALQSITLGARLSRLDVQITGAGENVDITLDGLALLSADQETDTHSAIIHAKPHCRSRQLHKVVLDDRSHAVFNGKIVVARYAQQTDSAQSARGLLLSDRARVDIKPELMIEADDVKCAHGAAIGQIDADQLFYLKSRGLDEAGSRDLLTYAFAAEVVDRVPLDSLRKQLRTVVMGRTDRKAKEAAK